MKLSSIKNFHPVLFGIFFVLSLFAFNIDLVLLQGYSEFLTLIFAVGGFSFLLWFGLNFIVKNKQKAGFLASFAIVMVFAYGHIISMPFVIIGELYFLIFWTGVFIAGFYGILKIKKELQNITTILFFISLSLIILPLVDVVEYQQSLSSYKVGDTDGIDTTVKSFDTKPPNIYYMIFDRYPASKTLSELYDYDNSDFINYLESKGFYVAHESMANYPFTFQSLASSKNMKYINYLSEIAGDSNNRAIVYELDRFCEVCQFLKSQGYQYVHASSFFQPTATNVDIDDPTDDEVFVLPDFTALFYEITMISHVANLYSGITPIDELDSREDARKEKYQTILQKFEGLEKIPDSNKPVFVYSHMVIPHPSYVFDEEGNYVSFNESQKSSEKQQFREQLTFLNKKIKNLIDKLLNESETPPIIIIQSDEGPYPYRTRAIGAINYNFGSMPFEELETKIRIFNAYYLPDSDKKELYPSISPVNTFRVVFNEYFDTNLEILPDHYYVYSDRDHYYNFINVTNKILDPSIQVIDPNYKIDGQFDWKKIGVESDKVDNFSYISEVLTIYYQREDLQGAYPEVIEGNLRHLLGWAGEYGLTVYPHLSKYDYIYELMTIYDKKNMHKKYPEVITKSDLSEIFVWAKNSGIPIYENLEKHLPIYDLMIVYSESVELQNSFPEAANGNNLSNLFCWAKNSGVEENTKLTPHIQFYSDKCLKST